MAGRLLEVLLPRLVALITASHGAAILTSSLVSIERYSDDGAYEATKQRGNEAVGTSRRRTQKSESIDSEKSKERKNGRRKSKRLMEAPGSCDRVTI